MHRGTVETWPPLAIIATLLGHRDHDSVCPVPPEDRCGRMFMNARKATSQLWSSSLPYCCPTVPVLGGAPFLALGEFAGLDTPSIVQLSSRELPGKRQTVVRASLSHCLPSSCRPVLRTLRKASERPGKDPIP